MAAEFPGVRSVDPAEVFVFRIGHFGDTVVALPAIHRIAQLHPGARLTLVTNAPSRKSLVTAWDVLKHTGLFSEALFYRGSDARGLAALAVRCRQRRDALLYYLSPRRSRLQMLRDYFFFRVACGLKIAGFERAPQPSMYDDAGQLRIFPREWERLLKLVDPAGVTPQAPFLSPPAAARTKADSLLQHHAGRVLVALGPGSKMPAKKWFTDRYLAVSRQLVASYPEVVLVVFGGDEDRSEGEALVHAIGADRAVNLAGATDIVESAAALQKCKLYIGNDTGTMHLAAVMGVPCVAVFTSRDNRDVWVPWGEAHEILRRDISCSGCMLVTCEEHKMRCLDLISVEDVLHAAKRRLDLS